MGSSGKPSLDEGAVLPVALGLTELTVADEARSVAVVKKARS